MTGQSNVVAFPTAHQDEEVVGLPLIAPGPYTATYVRHEGVQIFKVRKVRVLFRLLEHPGIELERWYLVQSFKGRISAPVRSDIVCEVQAALGRKIRHDQVPLASLKGIVVAVTVKTVVINHRQREHKDVNRYSVIESMDGRA